MTTATATALRRAFKAAGLVAYPRDGQRGVTTVEIGGYSLDVDGYGLVMPMKIGATNAAGTMTTLHFLSRDAREAAIAAYAEAMDDGPVAAAEAAVAAAEAAK